MPVTTRRSVADSNGQKAGLFDEIGTTGLEAWSGYVTKAYNAELEWPGVEPLYSRIWRSDPETTIVRHLMSAWSGELSPEWQVPEVIGPAGEQVEPSDDDKRAAHFANTVMSDMAGGLESWLQSCMTRAPFFGWGWWEVVAGLRREGWTAPNDDGWQSQHDDGLVGIRRLAFRDYSSFLSWDMDDHTGRVMGLEQLDPPNASVIIPADRSLHIRYGDLDNPEGLATLEAMWRLERLKYGLEVVQGIGYEHAAGHAKFAVRQKLDAEGKAAVSKSARALLTAQEGNYITELMDPEGKPIFTADVMDVPFAAAPSILEAIRYYGILKLALFGMQFVALSSLSGAGSFAALSDASEMALLLFNNMAGGFVGQAGEQLARWLFANKANAAAFPGMTRLPELQVAPLQKRVPLSEFSQFIQAIDTVMPLGDEDYIALRRRSEVLPETLPEDGEVAVKVNTAPRGDEPSADDEGEPSPPRAADEGAEMSQWFDLQQATPEAERAHAMADELNDEMRAIYDEWLVQAERELDEDSSREEVAALLALLLVRLRRRAELRMMQLADRVDATPAMLDAMRGQMEETLTYVEGITLPDLETAVRDALTARAVAGAVDEPKPTLTEALTGFGARVGMAGGILWTAYQEGKRELALAMEARWAGPNDERTCAPCDEQMRIGWRPAEQVPTPGPQVCRGLTNCRHDLIFRDPVTGQQAMSIDELR